MKRTNIVILASLVLVAVLFIALTSNPTQVAAKPNISVGGTYEIVEVLPSEKGKLADFIFLDDDGNRISLSEYVKGKYIFQNFWGTWCPPCRAEIPDIIKLQEENAEQVIMIGIALERDPNNQKKRVSDYSKSQGINYINFVGPQTLTNKLQAAYGGIRGVPTTHLINKEGVIVETIVGARSKLEFQSSLDKMMR